MMREKADEILSLELRELWNMKSRKLRIVTDRSLNKVSIFAAETGEDIGAKLGIQKVWYNPNDGAPFLSLDLTPDIEIEQIDNGPSDSAKEDKSAPANV